VHARGDAVARRARDHDHDRPAQSPRTVSAPFSASPAVPTSTARQRGSALAQFAIVLASIGVIALAVLQFFRA
jgi:hypothetical protein